MSSRILHFPHNPYLVSFIVGFLFSVISFISNWLMQLHLGNEPSAFALFDISFYYFVPLVSWMILTYLFVRVFSNRFSWIKIRNQWYWLVCSLIVLSAFIRVVDILLDFTIKYLIGMVETNPLLILNDVWLVVLSSIPMAMLKVILIGAIIQFLVHKKKAKNQLVLKTTDGMQCSLYNREVLYCQSNGNYVEIHTTDKMYKVRSTLRSMLTELGNEFTQVHRSLIINPEQVDQLKHWRNGEYLIIMTNGKHLTSSRSFKQQVDSVKDLMSNNRVDTIQPILKTSHPLTA